MYKSKYHSVLRIYTYGFRKHRSNIYMANNYALLSRFHWPCLLVCFVVDFDYLYLKKCLNVFVEITFQSTASCNTSVERIFSYRLFGILIAWVDWSATTATTDVCVTLTPNFRFGVPPHKRSKYIFCPYFFTGNISFHVLDISKLNKELVWVSSGGRGGGGGSRGDQFCWKLFLETR